MPPYFNPRPDSPAEKLVHDVFGTLEREADSTIARQRLANQLRRGREQSSASAVARPLMRPIFKVAAFFCGLILMASFAGNIQLPGWDDGQQVTMLLPASFSPNDYNHWVALFANRADELSVGGGHSLVVDYYSDASGRYFLKLNILGVNYSEANEWVRDVMAGIPDLGHSPYSIQQPLVPYTVTVRDMLAFQLGNTDGVERSVMRAWYAEGQRPSRNCYMFLVARPKDAPRPIFGENF